MSAVERYEATQDLSLLAVIFEAVTFFFFFFFFFLEEPKSSSSSSCD